MIDPAATATTLSTTTPPVDTTLHVVSASTTADASPTATIAQVVNPNEMVDALNEGIQPRVVLMGGAPIYKYRTPSIKNT